jgi:hypothetical protein
MRRLRPPPTVEPVIDGLERRPEMKKKTLVITASAVVLIVVAAAATLGVLTAYAGQQSGLHRCAKLSPAAVGAVADPGYGPTLAKLARCPR